MCVSVCWHHNHQKCPSLPPSLPLSFSLSLCLSHTRTCRWVGSTTYMSPERIAGLQYHFNSDIWSFGITLVELLLGCFPYMQGGGGQVLDMMDLLDRCVMCVVTCVSSPHTHTHTHAHLYAPACSRSCLVYTHTHTHVCVSSVIKRRWISSVLSSYFYISSVFLFSIHLVSWCYYISSWIYI
jgi:serine/threonine protein kinase